MPPRSLHESPVVMITGAVLLGCMLIATSVPNLLRARMSARESHLFAMAAAAAPSLEGQAKTVQTGSLMLTVKSPADTCDRIRQLVEQLGGFLVSSETSGTGAASTASITIRIPANRFEEAQAGIHKLATRVETERLEAKDVTKDYVDRAARLRNLLAQEAQYLGILKRAATIKETLEVTAKLNEVRSEIEQQQGEFDTLTKEVETVALAISLQADAEAQVFGLHWRPLDQLKHAAAEGLDSVADYASTMATILFYLPAVVLWLATVLAGLAIGWRIFRWAGKAFFLPKSKTT